MLPDRVTNPGPLTYESGALVPLLSMPMCVNYIAIGFDMEVQPLVTHNAA